ncbi:MAG: cytochrome C552 [Methylobacterium sp.]|uniref:c-type cytochrome n=1 Tax=Methylobacterium sp. TaxID=409 RepID=UPI002727B438|nr:cytochrome c [Methylobacterium sp.]MDO9427783.1 cytochrome C552 [Methylobacterium sp.]
MTWPLTCGWGLCIATALSLGIAPQAAAAPEVENHRIRGWTLAAENCSQCHAIGKGAGADVFAGPSFTAVAAMPSTTGMALNVFLQSHHQRMPSVRLDRDEMDAVIDYILSLKRAEPSGR